MISDTQLYTLINHLPGPAHARTTDTGKYFIANQYHATNHGFSDINASIGITFKDIYYHRSKQIEMLQGSLILEVQHRQVVERLNIQADRSTKSLCARVCTLFPTGFILDGVLRKVPILGHTRSAVAILTFFEDRTYALDLLELYHLYKKHYPMQRGIIQFLKYLGIKKYFHKLPTNQEMTILLILRENPISKYAAKVLSISYRTVEEYKARLRNKLALISLEDLLILLRMHPTQPLSINNVISSSEERVIDSRAFQSIDKRIILSKR